EHTFTLTVTEITTGWTELRAIKNKARVWTLGALEDILDSVPFPVKHLHSDNGSEFINHHTVAFARKHNIPFTRSRTYLTASALRQAGKTMRPMWKVRTGQW
ncbi:MAG: integrase catalytic domain-containing protein, partial [Candidatus Thorarchaeota archaeon]